MIVPVRCFTCGRVVGSHFASFRAAVDAGGDPKEALDATGLDRFCCRRMLVAHKDLITAAAQYE